MLPLSNNVPGCQYFLLLALQKQRRSLAVRLRCPQRPPLLLSLCFGTCFPTAPCSKSRCLCPVADVMGMVPGETEPLCRLLYVVMERAGWEKYETWPGCANSNNKDCCSLLQRHLCAQQQHSILITQRLSVSFSNEGKKTERRRKKIPRHVLKIKQHCTCSEY